MFEILHFVAVEYIPIILLGIMIGVRGPDQAGPMLLYTMNSIGGVGWSVFIAKNCLEAFSSPLCSADLHPDAAENLRIANLFFITCTQTNAFVLITFSMFVQFKIEDDATRLHLVRGAMGTNVLYFFMNPNGLVPLRIVFQALLIILYRIEQESESFFDMTKNVIKDCWSGMFNVACIILLLFMPLIQGCFINSISNKT